MKVKVWLEVAQEVEAEVDKDDLLAVFGTAPEDGETWMVVLNRFAIALHALPDTMIAAWKPGQRMTVHHFLAQQMARFADHDCSNAAHQEHRQP